MCFLSHLAIDASMNKDVPKHVKYVKYQQNVPQHCYLLDTLVRFKKNTEKKEQITDRIPHFLPGCIALLIAAERASTNIIRI